MSDQNSQPLPVPTEDSREFWQAAKEDRLLLQLCKSCGRHQFYPRALCSYCMSQDLAWDEAQGAGTVYSFTVVEIPPSPAFAGDVPYVIALVKLEEGVQMVSRIVGCKPDAVAIDMPVRVDFDHLDDAIALPQFRPADRS